MYYLRRTDAATRLPVAKPWVEQVAQYRLTAYRILPCRKQWQSQRSNSRLFDYDSDTLLLSHKVTLEKEVSLNTVKYCKYLHYVNYIIHHNVLALSALISTLV